MPLTIVQVAYAAAPVGPDAVGGSEQVLASLEQGLAAQGHRTIVVAAEGSRVAGRLIPTRLPTVLDTAGWTEAHAAHRAGLAEALRSAPDLVHMHGFDFHAVLPPPGVPVLVTLHLPPSWYPPEALRPRRPDTWLVPVSGSQAARCPRLPALLAPVPNGVAVERLAAGPPRRARGYALALGRICPEKNFHQAMDACARAGLPLLIGGALFPYPEHQRYWRTEIAPRLRRGPHRLLGSLGFARKRRLLAGAQCLVSASLAEETSSLVAMEAAACGTPVVAYAAGALPEIVEHGATGFLVHDAHGMAEAIAQAHRIDPARCQAVARERFPDRLMLERYLALYRRMLAGGLRAAA